MSATSTLPVVVSPTLAFAAGRVDSTAPVQVSLVRDGRPVRRRQLRAPGQHRRRPFQPVYEGTATSIKVFVPFKQTLVFRVRATDGVGNGSAWASAAPARSSPPEQQQEGRLQRPPGAGSPSPARRAPATRTRPRRTRRPARRSPAAASSTSRRRRRPAARSRCSSTASHRHLQPPVAADQVRQDHHRQVLGRQGHADDPHRGRQRHQADDLRHLPRAQVAGPRSAAPTPPARPAASPCPARAGAAGRRPTRRRAPAPRGSRRRTSPPSSGPCP